MLLAGDAGIILVVIAMFTLMAVGVPIFIAIGMAAVGGLWITFGLQQAMVDFTSFLWQSINTFELVTIPLFVLSGHLISRFGGGG